jgi:phosphomethylpyrimidine synthase
MAGDYLDHFPSSRKRYAHGREPGVRVPFREITLHDTLCADGATLPNPPVRVYDTSGPWTDLAGELEVRTGLHPLRQAWIETRADTEEVDGRPYRKGDDGVREAGTPPALSRAGAHPAPGATGRERHPDALR